MKPPVWMILAMSSVASQTALANGSFRFSRGIEVPASEQQELVAVALDTDVFAATRDAYPDLRIFDDRSQPVPYILRKAVASAAREAPIDWEVNAADPQVISIQSRRDPLTSITLSSATSNFERRATVESMLRDSAQGGWREIGRATISRIDFQEIQRENLTIPLPETRAAQFRVVIENDDNPPLDITDVTAEGIAVELIFLASPDRTYQLAYGSADAEPPHYDTAAIKALLAAGYATTEASLAAQTENADADSTASFRWSQFINDARVMIPALIVLVVLLGWGLFQAAKRLDRVE